jgi:uncharacterized protein
MSREREPNLLTSGLSDVRVLDGVRVQINIVRLENETNWTLEVVTPDGASTVWDAVFPSDDAAMAEFERTLAKEGVKTFLDQSNVVPFRR